MKTLFAIHPWKLIEEKLHREDMRLAESLTSLGNAHFGMRGNFEEAYSADCHRGTYLAGVWFPDKTRVGWWKNGYPKYFGKVINAANLIEIGVRVNDEVIDLGQNEVLDFYRELDMEHGILLRQATVRLAGGEVQIEVERFLSIARKEILAIRYRVTPSFAAEVVFTPALDWHVRNEDANYNDIFWQQKDWQWNEQIGSLMARTRENPYDTPRFLCCAAMWVDGATDHMAKPGRVECTVRKKVGEGEMAEICKLVAVDSSRNHGTNEDLLFHVTKSLQKARADSYPSLRIDQRAQWRRRWDQMDISLEGNDSAQQGIRYNLFQMLCTYDGTDPSLNIGPKGFTGEKYGGATYWDTEMFCFPMILSVLGEQASQNLILYRFSQLDKAKANAEKLGCQGALFPMVTFNGEECHNEWEITFEEIHRNAAIFYAIFMEQQYNGDDSFLREHGLPIMLEICRYWVSRVTFSDRKRQYMLLGVTGPNEYENNIANNWYTNRMAKFCLEQTAAFVRTVLGFRALRHYGSNEGEIKRFERVARRMYLPEDKHLKIFIQQDGFLHKEIQPASTIPDAERPICQHWSWDRILRSCYIKQADVLQGLYCLRHLYSEDVIRQNFLFYEPLTVHESSLSPCIHAVLAADLRLYDKAMEMYQRTSRLDLDNVNNDTEDGLHITSMAGSWIAIVKGFAGMRTEGGHLKFSPRIPLAFQGFSFRIRIQGRCIEVRIAGGQIALLLLSGAPLMLEVYDRWVNLSLGVVRHEALSLAEEEPGARAKEDVDAPI